MKFHIIFLITISVIINIAACVKQQDFKLCKQSSFCNRLRSLKDRKSSSSVWESPYILDGNINNDNDSARFNWNLKNLLAPSNISFDLVIDILLNGLIRIRIDEHQGLYQRYNLTSDYILIQQPILMDVNSIDVKSYNDVDILNFVTSNKSNMELTINHKPFHILLKNKDTNEYVIDINGEGLFHIEHYRQKDENFNDSNHVWKSEQPFEDDSIDGLWEETFNRRRDSKPKGPESFSIDINFPSHSFVYGIPEHASPLALPPTDGNLPKRLPYVENPEPYTEPYRLYNLDVFEYEPNSPMALYGSVPIMYAHSQSSSIGIFLLSASEMWVDVKYPNDKSASTQWIAESGIIDLFILTGPSINEVFTQYSSLVGTSQLPQLFSIGHHQCRWNYFTSKDMINVIEGFDNVDAPLDVIWLDIEYSEGHKYFIWDKKKYPNPVETINEIASKGRKTVNIIDPHLKRDNDYYVYDEASDLDILIKSPDGQSEFEGWCWSGSSSWLDMFNPNSWNWWKSLFKFNKWQDSNENLFIWNDMNEPSVFNGPEITLPKDVKMFNGYEHRDIHNINGILFHNLTSQALEERSKPRQRSFVLSRSFYAGSQRFGAVWTGDNLGTWDHLRSSTPMNLANSVGGIVFTGSDVGGFFGNPTNEFLVRWYQAGAFQPFFRAHAHIDTKRREPYLISEPYQTFIKNVLRLRYSLLTVWYTAFRDNQLSGLPVMRPQFLVHPNDIKGFDIDDQFYVGDSGLLFKPIVHENANTVDVYFSGDDELYYDYFTSEMFKGGGYQTLNAKLESIPLFIRGGSIIPTRQRARKSSTLMVNDPITITIALNKDKVAKGRLYMDDGQSFNYEKGEYIDKQFEFNKVNKGYEILMKDFNNESNSFNNANDIIIERINIIGLNNCPNDVKSDNQKLSFKCMNNQITIKKPNKNVGENFKILLN